MNAGVEELVGGQLDHRLHHVGVEHPLADVALARPGVARKERRAVVHDHADAVVVELVDQVLRKEQLAVGN